MKMYKALRPFAFENSYAETGATVELSDKQAKFLVTSGHIQAVETAASAPVTAPKKSTKGATKAEKGDNK